MVAANIEYYFKKLVLSLIIIKSYPFIQEFPFSMKKEYKSAENAWKNFEENVYSIIYENQFRDIAEIGGGANPLLPIDFVNSRKLNFHVIDISEEELNKADSSFVKIVADLEHSGLKLPHRYDFIFSQLTSEHIKDIRAFYNNIHGLLKPNGIALFFFACKTTLPTLSNHLLPEFLSRKILLFIQPFRKNENHGKFKAYYKWGFGPTSANIRRFENLNFEVLSYTGFFGHSYYDRVKILKELERLKTNFLLKHPNPYFCSYSQILIKKVENRYRKAMPDTIESIFKLA